VWGAAIVAVFAFFLLGFRLAPLFGLFAVAVWLSHIPLAHKEMRFLFPATPFLMIVAGLGTLKFLDLLKTHWPVSHWRLTAMGLVVWAIVARIVSIEEDFQLDLTRSQDTLAAQAAIRSQSDLCGLGLVGILWANTGGYVHLNRAVPIYPYAQPDGGTGAFQQVPERSLQQFNYAIANRSAPIGPGFDVRKCWDTVCIQKRDGICTHNGANEINRYLEQNAQ
jgi:hypothetical protein